MTAVAVKQSENNTIIKRFQLNFMDPSHLERFCSFIETNLPNTLRYADSKASQSFQSQQWSPAQSQQCYPTPQLPPPSLLFPPSQTTVHKIQPKHANMAFSQTQSKHPHPHQFHSQFPVSIPPIQQSLEPRTQASSHSFSEEIHKSPINNPLLRPCLPKSNILSKHSQHNRISTEGRDRYNSDNLHQFETDSYLNTQVHQHTYLSRPSYSIASQKQEGILSHIINQSQPLTNPLIWQTVSPPQESWNKNLVNNDNLIYRHNSMTPQSQIDPDVRLSVQNINSRPHKIEKNSLVADFSSQTRKSVYGHAVSQSKAVGIPKTKTNYQEDLVSDSIDSLPFSKGYGEGLNSQIKSKRLQPSINTTDKVSKPCCTSRRGYSFSGQITKQIKNLTDRELKQLVVEKLKQEEFAAFVKRIEKIAYGE